MIYGFTVGRLSCAVISDGQMAPPWWCTPWDHDTVRAVRARRRLLGRAADEHLLIHAYHMPFPGLGTIARHGDAYRWQPVRQEGWPVQS